MRVVYLADAPYIHTRRWVAHFVGLGWETHVISFRDAQLPGADVHHFGAFQPIGRLRYLLHARGIRRLIHELRPDLVHALHLTSYGFLAAFSRFRPTLTSVWGTDVLEAPHWTPLHLFITRYALARADHITATGLRLANATLQYLPRDKPVTVVPYGVDMERFQPPPHHGTRPGSVTIGSVARLSPEKGLDVLLAAARRLLQQGSEVRLILAGDGPSRSRLEKLAERLGIRERVEFRGEVPHEEVPRLLAELDIFVLPSRAEGFGVAALEAQAMELPIVASRVHGIPDVVDDGRTGLLVPPGEAEALAEALGRLVADSGLRAEMGRAARAFVQERYRWQDSTAQMERLYQHLLSAFPGGPARATVA